MANAEWIDWQGGERPVESEQRVEVRRRNGHVGYGYGRTFYWDHKGWPGDILAYRIANKKHRMAP